jgi:hypothetical protein
MRRSGISGKAPERRFRSASDKPVDGAGADCGDAEKRRRQEMNEVKKSFQPWNLILIVVCVAGFCGGIYLLDPLSRSLNLVTHSGLPEDFFAPGDTL